MAGKSKFISPVHTNGGHPQRILIKKTLPTSSPGRVGFLFYVQYEGLTAFRWEALYVWLAVVKARGIAEDVRVRALEL
jgi:hypothetical protein